MGICEILWILATIYSEISEDPLQFSQESYYLHS